MGGVLNDQAFGVLIFFILLDSAVVCLRMYVRLYLKKSQFGYDDVFLLITYVGLVLFVAFAFQAMHYGIIAGDIQPWYDSNKANWWSTVMEVVCFVISGTVKVSVALVIYRLLDYREVLKGIIIGDIVLCLVWTIVSTTVLSLGCTGTSVSPYSFTGDICRNFNYAQEASYLFFDLFHVAFPTALVWNVQINGGQKSSVIILFSLGLLSSIAVVLKLIIIVELQSMNSVPKSLWQQAVIWSACEHGLSLFSASILALRPLAVPLHKSWETITDTISTLYSTRRGSWATRPGSVSSRKHSWAARSSRKSSAYDPNLSTSRSSAPMNSEKRWNLDLEAMPDLVMPSAPGATAAAAPPPNVRSPSNSTTANWSGALNDPPPVRTDRTNRATPDYFSYVYKSKGRNMSVAEYLGTMGVSSISQESPVSEVPGEASLSEESVEGKGPVSSREH